MSRLIFENSAIIGFGTLRGNGTTIIFQNFGTDICLSNSVDPDETALRENQTDQGLHLSSFSLLESFSLYLFFLGILMSSANEHLPCTLV